MFRPLLTTKFKNNHFFIQILSQIQLLNRGVEHEAIVQDLVFHIRDIDYSLKSSFHRQKSLNKIARQFNHTELTSKLIFLNKTWPLEEIPNLRKYATI
jgi:hypothetical protein